MNGSDFSLKHFHSDKAGYDLLAFALVAAVAGSIAVVALLDKWGDVISFLAAVIHGS